MSEAKWKLRSIRGRGLPDEVIPDENGITFGRDPSCDVVVPSEHFPHVSGRHVVVRLQDASPFVEDLGSKNGTLLNGKAVDQSELHNGDILQLGDLGPRFLVSDSTEVSDTATVNLDRREREPKTLGETAMLKMRQALRIDRELDEAVRRRGRRNLVVMLVILGVVIAGAIYGFVYLKEQGELGESRVAELDRRIAMNQELNQSLLEERDRLIEATRQELETQQQRLDAQREALLTERDAIAARIQTLADDRSSQEQLTMLRRELNDTTQRLGLFDPVNLNQRKLDDVARVREAIVLIEVAIVFREEKSGKLFYLDRDAKTGSISGNLDGKGMQLRRESTGSGFGISKDGWILTCGHVVRPTGWDERLPYGSKNAMSLVPEVEVQVVYSGTETRYPAVVHDVVYDDDNDIALIKIEPFEGMKYIENFTADPERRFPGSDVYLFGFPLGKHTIQEGDRMIASTFRGILSRYVDNFIQIDAAVHPGNSGGPLTDEAGTVIGIVSRVQANPQDGSIVADIGYVLPISDVQQIWPPKT